MKARLKITSYDQLEDRLCDLGFTFQRTARHVKVFDKAGACITVLPISPSDWRSVKNSICDVRRRTGIDVRKLG